MAEPAKLMQVRDGAEGDDVCGLLRAAGIRCAVEPLPDANSNSEMVGIRIPDALYVLVDDADLQRARGVVSTHARHSKH